MNTVRQGVYVGVLLAALASVVALLLTVLASRPEPYVLSGTGVASRPVLGQGSQPACVIDETVPCTRPGQAKGFDMGSAVGLMKRTNPVLELEVAEAEPAAETAESPEDGNAQAVEDAADEAADEQKDESADRSDDKPADADRSEDKSDPVERPTTTTTARRTTTTKPTAPTETRPTVAPDSDAEDDEDDRPAADRDEDDGAGREESDDDSKDDDKASEAASVRALQRTEGPSTSRQSDTSQTTTTVKQGGGEKSDGDDNPDSDDDGHEVSDFEQKVIELTNSHRRAAGCEPLTVDTALSRAARTHSVDMAEQEFFAHKSPDGSTPGDRAVKNGYVTPHVAENIAWGYRSPQAVVDGWMDSDGHRGNILNCRYVHVGVGFHDFYWTQNFGIPK